uniref:hypothetical protein n=1 Tax=Nonomuraea sp. CA-252377 TaxID=3240003 RepID=UPI003F493816
MADKKISGTSNQDIRPASAVLGPILDLDRKPAELCGTGDPFLERFVLVALDRRVIFDGRVVMTGETDAVPLREEHPLRTLRPSLTTLHALE